MEPHECPFDSSSLTCNGLNAIASNCGNDCEATCDISDTTGCVPYCDEPSCICAPGFVRNVLTNECIVPIDCPRFYRCDDGEVLLPCGIAVCDGMCSEIDRFSNIDDCSTAGQCVTRCFCRPYYTGYCVSRLDCFV
ncbi:uncharacterized protein LOC143912913 [Arctopsyche grandis]|uniref:uncharacterized protein LOC143912913 n=1 Tax=Arctopsyche grandis TaxID=121162 RepID=UPI00406D7F45